MSLIDFQSAKELEKDRNWKKEVRKAILEKAKEKHERKRLKEEEAIKKGEGTWMVPSVAAKFEKTKKKKKKKSEKKHKKEKRKKYSSSSSDESESEADDWVEKKLENSEPIRKEDKNESQESFKRQEWMEATSLFKTYTRDEMKIKDGSHRTIKKLEELKKKEEANKPGSHKRELNPYYKEGGVGLPSEEAKPKVASPSYDATWLRKALERAQVQAKAEGRTLEDVAKDRWGSLETFYKLLNEAEVSTKDKINENSSKDKRDYADMKKMPVKRNIDDYEYHKRSRRRSGSRERQRSSHSRERQRRSHSRERQRRSHSRERQRRSHSRERYNRKDDRDKRSHSKERNHYGQKNSRDRKLRQEYSSSSSSSSDDERVNSNRSKNVSSKLSLKNRMLQPPDSDEDRSIVKYKKPGDIGEHSYNNSGSRSSNWRKINSERVTDERKLQRKKSLSPEEILTNHFDREKMKQDEKMKENEVEKIKEKESEVEKIKEKEVEKSKIKDKEVEKETSTKVLSDKEMNQLAAKLTKAEILGNETLVNKLEMKLEKARLAREERGKRLNDKNEEETLKEETVILSYTDASGFTRPISSSEVVDRKKVKKQKAAKTHDQEGKRTSYFPDDHKSDLKSMFEKEKNISAEEQLMMFSKKIAKEKVDDDYDVDDMFMTKIAPRESSEKQQMRERDMAIKEHRRTQNTLDSCHFCLDNKLMKKHLMVSLGSKCYLSVPHHESLTEGHCFIVPIHHITCTTVADEDLWEEITSYRQALVRMFESRGEDCMFIEMATGLRRLPHMVIQCVPLPKEVGELAPIYFKKAIDECDEEWAQNKKLVDLKGRSIRKAVPKGLPYFWVDFAMTPGYAHVIENELKFNKNFGLEIIGGMIDADVSLYRKPRPENFDSQRKKALQFSQDFEKFDPST